MLLLTFSPAVAKDRAGDEFPGGDVASILERDNEREKRQLPVKIVNWAVREKPCQLQPVPIEFVVKIDPAVRLSGILTRRS